MTTTETLFVEARPFTNATWFQRFKPTAHRLLQIPGLHHFRPLAERTAAVARPAGEITFQSLPSQHISGNGRALTLLSANLCHDWPRYRRNRARLESLARLIEKERVDVALLQEVSRTPDLHADAWLAKRLGMSFAYARANGHSNIRFEEGVAIFSRFPLAEPALIELYPGQNPFTRRISLGVQVSTPAGNFSVFSAHLGLMPKQNAAQLSHLQNWIQQLAKDRLTVIGGDFNAHETSAQILQAQRTWIDTFRHLHPQADGATYEQSWPWGRTKRRLDYLFMNPGTGGWQVTAARHLDAPGGPHSDHRAVLARIEMV